MLQSEQWNIMIMRGMYLHSANDWQCDESKCKCGRIQCIVSRCDALSTEFVQGKICIAN